MDIKEEGGRVEEVILESLLAGKPRAAGSHVSGSQEWELQWRGKWCFAFIHADFCITPFSTPGLSGRFASGPCSVLRKEMSKTSGTRPRMDLGREETRSVPADHRVHRPTPRIRKAKLNGPKSPTSRPVWPHFRRLTTIEGEKTHLLISCGNRSNVLISLNLLRYWRRGPGSNRRIKVLQTSPLPLGYRALAGLSFLQRSTSP